MQKLVLAFFGPGHDPNRHRVIFIGPGLLGPAVSWAGPPFLGLNTAGPARLSPRGRLGPTQNLLGRFGPKVDILGSIWSIS